MRLSIVKANPIPLIPFPLRGRGRNNKRGEASLELTLSGKFEGAKLPLLLTFPLPFQGRGIKGDGLAKHSKGDFG